MASETGKGELVLVVDDDSAVRETLRLILEGAGFAVQTFADGAAFIEYSRQTRPALVLLDVYMPEKSGLDVLRELPARGYPAPILMMSGRGEIQLAITAIKIGAFDFIEKPFRGAELIAKVSASLSSFSPEKSESVAPAPAATGLPGWDALTRRERDALAEFVEGASNKEAARKLGLSPRTVEEHRANIMRKLGARNTADLVRITLTNRGGVG
jgi:FixJ family two-component response regulator